MSGRDQRGPGARLRGIDARARKSMGQHFLANPAVAKRIVHLAGVERGSRVLEIGPGLGALTEPLIEAGASIVALERDRRLADDLAQRWPALRLERADAMRTDFAELLDGAGWLCVSNLPYNVGTHLVARMMRLPGTFTRLVVMLQREVADRICAEPGSKTYGGLSIEVQARARAEVVLRVRPGSFHPAPKVESAVVRIDLGRPTITQGLDLGALDGLVRAAFQQRRKTLRRSLGSALGKDRAVALLEAAGIDSGERPERLALEEFAALVRVLPTIV